MAPVSNRALAGFGFDKKLDAGDDCYALRFKNESGEARYALWAPEWNSKKVDLSKEIKGPFKVFDLFGHPMDVPDASSIPLDASVKYLVTER